MGKRPRDEYVCLDFRTCTSPSNFYNVVLCILPFLDGNALRALRGTSRYYANTVDEYVRRIASARRASLGPACPTDASDVGLYGITNIRYLSNYILETPAPWKMLTELKCASGMNMEKINQLILLQELHLHGNQLTVLPDAIGGLVSLQTLDLSRNQLTELPDAIDGLVSLRVTYLRGNQITGYTARTGRRVVI